MGQVLKINTTLTKLNLWSWGMKSFYFWELFLWDYSKCTQQTDNRIGDIGTIELSKALETNTTLISLDLNCLRAFPPRGYKFFPNRTEFELHFTCR